MTRIVELSPRGLRSYGGDFALYEALRCEEQDGARKALAHARAGLKRDEDARRVQRERQQRRAAHGDRAGKEANQAAILLGRGRQRSEGSAGRLRQRHDAALARALYADPAPALLLLDEPTNHLDLDSLAALEAMLNGYGGVLAVVSHDAVFLDRIGLTHRLAATDAGWRLEAS